MCIPVVTVKPEITVRTQNRSMIHDVPHSYPAAVEPIAVSNASNDCSVADDITTILHNAEHEVSHPSCCSARIVCVCV